MIKSNDGSVFLGGKSKKLDKLDLNLKLISSFDLGDEVYCGIKLNHLIVCGLYYSYSLRVFDSSLKLFKEIKLKSSTKKLLLLED